MTASSGHFEFDNRIVCLFLFYWPLQHWFAYDELPAYWNFTERGKINFAGYGAPSQGNNYAFCQVRKWNLMDTPQKRSSSEDLYSLSSLKVLRICLKNCLDRPLRSSSFHCSPSFFIARPLDVTSSLLFLPIQDLKFDNPFYKAPIILVSASHDNSTSTLWDNSDGRYSNALNVWMEVLWS